MAEDIFLSYSATDHDTAQRIAGLLEDAGWSVWWDKRLRAGTQWRASIEEALCHSRCMVVLWSGNSVRSDWVKEEAELAREAGKLVPVRISDVRPPLGFRELEYADLSRWDGTPDAAAFKKLVLDLVAVLGQPHPPAATDGAQQARVPHPARAADGVALSGASRHGLHRSPPIPRALWLAAGAAVLLLAITAVSLGTWQSSREPAPPVPAANIAPGAPVPAAQGGAPDAADDGGAASVTASGDPAAPVRGEQAQPPGVPVHIPEPASRGDRSPAPDDADANQPPASRPAPGSERPSRPASAPHPRSATAQPAAPAADARCTDILMRLQLGEPVPQADRAFLRQSCQ